MVEFTIRNLLEGDLPPFDRTTHKLYVVREGETVFYVGKSAHPIKRLCSHLGVGPRGRAALSQLGRLVEQTLPRSLNWEVQLFTPGECGIEGNLVKPVSKEEFEVYQVTLFRQVLFEWRADIEGTESVHYDDDCVDLAERELIAALHPCLNVSLNLLPGTLPDKYRNLDLDLETTVSDFIPMGA